MKFLYDYFPIICFFVAYKLAGFFVATAVAMIASGLQVLFYWLHYRKFEKLHIITFILIVLAGGTTLIFHDEIFFKWKPSIIYWLFSLVIFSSQFIGHSPVLKRMLGDKIHVPNKIWNRINSLWGGFFLLLGGLNIYVVYHYSTNAWVNFKLFGTLGLLLVFAVLQALYMARYMHDESNPDEPQA